MLDKLFVWVLNMSLISSYAVVLVLIARILLKKAPKIFPYVLWGVVLFRLVCPFSFESILSLIPTGKTPISQDIIYSATSQISTGIATFDNASSTILSMPSNAGDSVNPIQIWLFIGAVIWVIGMAAMVIYCVAAFIKLKISLIGAAPFKANIYLADHISSPFVMGLFKPKIYLPSTLTESETDFIIAHEMCHVRRFDHVTRIIGFVALAVHWFNPFVWIAFILSAKDMEMSCDEAVMKKMSTDIRAEYAQSLLRFRTDKRMIHATPLAFGEGDTKSRVKNVLNYKKPAFWVIIVAVAGVIALGFGLITNPKAIVQDPPDQNLTGSVYLTSFELYNSEGKLIKAATAERTEDATELASLLLQGTDKTQASVNDTPQNVKEYLKLDIGGDSDKVYFVYEQGNKYWIEKPYDYKRELEEETYTKIMGIFEKHFGITAGNLGEGTVLPTLTEETAAEFINKTLSTFMLNSDDTVSFTLPAVIPTDEEGKTKLAITSSATFSPEPGTSNVQELLDFKEGWQGGERFTQKLEMSRGKLTRLFLRVVFKTDIEENSYRDYAANYIELFEPFKYDTPVNVVDRSVQINKVGANSVLKYTMQNGDNFSITLELPKGLTLSRDDNSQPSDIPGVMVAKDGKLIGSLILSGFGTDEKESLSQVDTAKNTMPMQIFAPIALSNHAQFDNYKVLKSSATAANATADYLWQDLTDYGGRAPDAPWLKSDSILAFDYEKIPFLIYIELTDGSLSTIELEDLAKSIVIAD